VKEDPDPMSLQTELGLREPIRDVAHEALISMVLTGSLLVKEGDRLLRPFALTDSQFNVLMLLKYQTRDGAMSQTQLGRMLLVNRSNVTGLVDRMEQSGWVERGGEPGDRRVKQVRLTAAGRRQVDRAEKAYKQRRAELMKSLSDADLRQLCRTLEKVRMSLK
jgi:DNA-binding MarR family transcriptional regulator